MTELANPDAYGELTRPDTLKIQRLLPGPIERVWAYLTESDMRRQWLAAGEMTLEVDAPFEFVWRNDELTDPPGQAPPNHSGEDRLDSRITELNSPYKIAFEWDGTGGVTFELESRGDQVLLTMTHRRVTDRSTLLSVSSGWHTHLDLLVMRLSDREPEPFWDQFRRVKSEYERRLPA